MEQKNNGAFYTPEPLADWIAQYVVKEISFEKGMNILEAGCGDGVFLRALDKCDKSFEFNVLGIDSDEDAIKRARDHSYKLKATFVEADFLVWEESEKFDLVIGNPPYVAKKRLSKERAILCRKIHKSAFLSDREVANLWTVFVIKSIACLSSKGIAAFVLPTELMQVKYAEEIRDLLVGKFKRLEIISFKRLAFSNTEQDTIVLVCYSDTSKKHGVYFSEVTSIDELKNSITYTTVENIIGKKWTGSVLSKSELDLLYGISLKCNKVSDYCTAVAGIVTAANSFFIVNLKTVEDFKLHDYIKPIIQRGLHVNGSVRFSEEHFDDLNKLNMPCWLLDLNLIEESSFTNKLHEYLNKGSSDGINKRYKCILRSRWFDIPSIWNSEGFFFKRCHHYPKLLVNSANVHVTDTAYRIKMLDGHDINSFTFSFYNSFTLAIAELSGRYYGGGVLEITPNEFKGMAIPYTKINKAG